MEIIKRIESVMIDAGVKPRKIKSKIAEICGIRVQSVHGWFNGTTKSPSAENVAAIAERYDADLMYLITGRYSKSANQIRIIQAMVKNKSPFYQHPQLCKQNRIKHG